MTEMLQKIKDAASLISNAVRVLRKITAPSRVSVRVLTDARTIANEVERDKVADVLFVHGLGGHPWSTWSESRSADDFWPYWVADELPVRVHSLEYPTDVSPLMNGNGAQRVDLIRIILERIDNSGIGRRPWVIVAHSMGGIIAKMLVVEAVDAEQANLVSNLRGILFIATPHQGSHVANIASRVPGIAGRDVKYLKSRSTWSQLEIDHERFMSSVAGLTNFSKTGMYEALETKGIQVVPRLSALHGMDNQANDPYSALPGDHIACCKPLDKRDSAFVRTIVSEHVC